MKKARPRPSYTARVFKRQVAVFTGITILVLLAIVYFAFSKTTITVTPALLAQSVTATLRVGPTTDEEGDAKNDLRGVLLQKELTVRSTATPSPASTEAVPAKAGGTVTIVNHWSRVQPLQAGTRLLSDGGVLFRTTARVDVPAGGSVQAAVIADTEGTAGEIGPSRFTIVALWPGLQDKIYGESTEPFTGGSTTVRKVTQEDLNKARIALGELITKEAGAQLEALRSQQKEASALSLVAIGHTLSAENPGAALGDQVDTFTYTATANVVGIAAEETAFLSAARAKLAAETPDDRRLLDSATLVPAAAVKESDAEHGTAVITVRADAKAVVKNQSPIFDTSRLTNYGRSDIAAYFKQFPEVEKVDVRFSPFWVIRTPTLPDHIEIRVLEPALQSARM